MSNLTDFNSKEEVLTAMPKEEVEQPNVSIDSFLQNSENLYVWCKDDKAPLKAAGLSWQLVDDLPVRIGACRHAESIWNKEKNTRTEAREEWKRKSPELYEFRDDLIADLGYAFRKEPELLNVIDNIKKGSGNADMIQDLSDLAVLGKDNLKLTEAIGVTKTKFDKAAQMSDEGANLMAEVNGDLHEENSSKVMRDKAFTHLKQAMDEILDCGRYVFRKNPDRLKGYRSPYI